MITSAFLYLASKKSVVLLLLLLYGSLSWPTRANSSGVNCDLHACGTLLLVKTSPSSSCMSDIISFPGLVSLAFVDANVCKRFLRSAPLTLQ